MGRWLIYTAELIYAGAYYKRPKSTNAPDVCHAHWRNLNMILYWVSQVAIKIDYSGYIWVELDTTT